MGYEMNKVLIVILSLIFLISCQKVRDKSPSFILSIPDTIKTHRPNLSYELIKRIGHELNFQNLENGIDSIEVRIWAKAVLINYGQVIILKYVNKQWRCYDYSYWERSHWEEGMSFLDQCKTMTVDSFYVRPTIPKSEYNKFLSKLVQAGILEIPDQNEIENWKNCVTDGNSFYIEIATKGMYKFYHYNCPDVYENQYKECRKMVNILEIFNNEIGLRLPQGTPGNPYLDYRCLRSNKHSP